MNPESIKTCHTFIAEGPKSLSLWPRGSVRPRLSLNQRHKKTHRTHGSSMSLSVSLSAPPLSVVGLSLVGGGHDGDPLSKSGGPGRLSPTRATPQRGSAK